MSFDYSPTPPPVDPRDQAGLLSYLRLLKAWIARELRKISDNLVYQREGWNDVRVAVIATKLGGSKDPGFAQFADDGAGSQGVFAYNFDKNQEEEVYFEIQLPHGRVPDSELRPHAHWAPIGTDTGNVVIGLELVGANVGDVFGNTTISTAPAKAAAGVSKTHQISGFAAIPGEGVLDSCVYLCRVFRDATNAADTFNGDVVILSLDFHCLLRDLGSDEEYPV